MGDGRGSVIKLLGAENKKVREKEEEKMRRKGRDRCEAGGKGRA